MPLSSVSADSPHKMLKDVCQDMEALIEKLPPDLYNEGFAILLNLTKVSTGFHIHIARIIEEDVILSEKKTELIKQIHRMQDKTYQVN